MLDQTKMLNVDSSNIKAIFFDKKKKELYVKFHGGRIYKYFKVDEVAYVDLHNAPSVGKHFAVNIKKQYDCEEYRG